MLKLDAAQGGRRFLLPLAPLHAFAPQRTILERVYAARDVLEALEEAGVDGLPPSLPLQLLSLCGLLQFGGLVWVEGQYLGLQGLLNGLRLHGLRPRGEPLIRRAARVVGRAHRPGFWVFLKKLRLAQRRLAEIR